MLRKRALAASLLVVMVILAAALYSVPVRSEVSLDDLALSSDKDKGNKDHSFQNKEKKIIYQGDSAAGAFVSFTIEPLTGLITNYTLNGSQQYRPIDSIAIESFHPSDIETEGAAFKVQSDDVKMMVHDNPTGLVNIQVKGAVTNVSVLLAPSMAVMGTYTSQGNSSVSIEGGGVRGIIACENGTLNVARVSTGTFVNATLSQGIVSLRFTPVTSAQSSELDAAIQESILSNNVCGEVLVSVGDGASGLETIEYDGEVQFSLTENDGKRVHLSISSSEHRGKVVLITLDRSLGDGSELSITMDGSAVPRASSIYEVLYAVHVGSSDAAFSSSENNGTTLIALYVPSFSTHAVMIEGVTPTSLALSPLTLLLEAGVIAAIVLAAVLLFRRK